MPIELSWLLPDTILLSRWSGDIAEPDVRVLVDELGIILDNAPRLIHTIIDLSETRVVHDEAAYYYFRSRIPRHPRRGRVALVKASFHSRALADVLNRISQREMFRLFDSRDEARDFLLRHDTPPPGLPAYDLPTSESSDHLSPPP
jgi:hypothetical protein